MKKTLIVIPVRMASKRFPGKPLIKIRGKSMLIHVWERAIKSKVGDVVIACCDNIIVQELEKYNVNYVMTKKHHKSGSDRVCEAYIKLSKFKKYDYVINLQGDIPNITHTSIQILNKIISNSNMATLVTLIRDKNKINNVNIVKTVLSKKSDGKLSAIYFSRLPIPMNAKKYYEHVGIYAYNIVTLKKFIKLKSSFLENSENLEQLRALENNIKIDIGIIKDTPFSIDTPEDLKNFNNINK